MPHIVLEYSANLESDLQQSKLLSLLYKTIVEFGIFTPESVKARSIRYEDFILSNSAKSFLHLTIAILAERSEELRAKLADTAITLIRDTLEDVDKVSVEIREMDASSYRK